MKTKLSLILAIMAISTILCTSCQDLQPQGTSLSGFTAPYVAHVYTVDELFPNGEALPFLIYPMDGWVIGPGETILFKALLLNADGKTYTDVTNKTECQFNFSYGSGKCVSGDDPSYENCQEITVRAVWNKKWGAATTGRFFDNRER